MALQSRTCNILILQSLHYAVQNKHIEIVKMLLDAGADTEVINSNGLKPGDLATALGHNELEYLFPIDIPDDIPIQAEQYRTYEDLAPLIFPDLELSVYLYYHLIDNI